MQIQELLIMQTLSSQEGGEGSKKTTGDMPGFAGLLEMFSESIMTENARDKNFSEFAGLEETETPDNLNAVSKELKLIELLTAQGFLNTNLNMPRQIAEVKSGENSDVLQQSAPVSLAAVQQEVIRAQDLNPEGTLQIQQIFTRTEKLIDSLKLHDSIQDIFKQEVSKNVLANLAETGEQQPGKLPFRELLKQSVLSEYLPDSVKASSPPGNNGDLAPQSLTADKSGTEITASPPTLQDELPGPATKQKITANDQQTAGEENGFSQEKVSAGAAEDDLKIRSTVYEDNKPKEAAGTEKGQNTQHSNNKDAGYLTDNLRPAFDTAARSVGTETLEPEVPVKEIPEFLLKQISGKFLANKSDGTQELNIRLKPAELGKMSLHLTANNGQVTVKILTDNMNARELVEQNIIHLKQSLADQGIKCNAIDVQVNADSSFNQFMGHQSNPFNQSRQSSRNKVIYSNNKKRSNDILTGIENSKQPAKPGLSRLELLA
ncbi:MAG: flagellar hook-length control protein FliK [Peptococcaceae bacterium]